MRDPTDALQAPADNAAAEKAKRKRLQEIEDIKWLMAHPAGRRVVCRLLTESGVFRTSFHNSGSTMAFNEGRKTIGYMLTGELMELTPDAYLKLLKEFADDN
jgi:hypothetical protein